MKRQSPKALSYHRLEHRKLNLVTTDLPGGGIGDIYLCLNCGKRIGIQTFFPTNGKTPGRCVVSAETYKAEMHESKGKVLGWWSSEEDPFNMQGACYKCGGRAGLVPRTGHPNSPFWRLNRFDGDVLVCCLEGCEPD